MKARNSGIWALVLSFGFNLRTVHNILVLLYAISLLFGFYDYISHNIFCWIGISLTIIALFFLFYDRDELKVKKLRDITSYGNVPNYLQILYLLTDTPTGPIHPFGTYIKLSILFLFLLLSICVILLYLTKQNKVQRIAQKIRSSTYYNFIEKERLNQKLPAVLPAIFGHAILGVFVFLMLKSMISLYYGKKELNSFFEMPEYSAKYYVNIYDRENRELLYNKVPAKIRVFQRTTVEKSYDELHGDIDEYEVQEKVIQLDKFYLNARSISLSKKCELELKRKVFSDNYYVFCDNFYIELLSDEKVE